jgi:LPS-assembly lipoprotein
MSWSRRGLLALLLLPLGGCGFRPLYASLAEDGGNEALAAIRVERIPERPGQLLAEALRERFNPTAATVPTRYVLSVLLNYGRGDSGIQRDASSTRGSVVMSATFRLFDAKTSQLLYTGSSRATSEFNILNDAYSATVAELDARERGVRDLTQDIGLQLAMFLQRERARS